MLISRLLNNSSSKGIIMCYIAIKPRPVVLNVLPIMLLSSAEKVAYYAQYYAHKYCNYATIYMQFINFNN